MSVSFSKPPRVAMVWRGDAAARRLADPFVGRLSEIAVALAKAGFAPEACLFNEGWAEQVRDQLLRVDAVLVWVNPIAAEQDRSVLDALLVEVANAGVLVSARPDVIAKMGVKAVLYLTRHLGWGSDVDFYPDAMSFAAAFPARVEAGPRVLKRNRGNDGIGVWKVEAIRDRLVVQEAHAGSTAVELSMSRFLSAWGGYADLGGLVDQAFQPRLPEGMTRCYMSGVRLVGFGHHMVRALAQAEAGPGGPRLYSGPDDPRFQRLRSLMETEWTPQMARLLDIESRDLPVIWDADFLLGPRAANGDDTYVLCEINVSSVFPIPAEAPTEIARTLVDRLQ